MKKILTMLLSVAMILMMAVPAFATNGFNRINYMDNGHTVMIVNVKPEEHVFSVKELALEHMPYGYTFNTPDAFEVYGDLLNVYLDRLVKPLKNVNARLCKYSGGYDDIYITWGADSYATAYETYMRRPAVSKEWEMVDGVGAKAPHNFTAKNLADGYRYEIKVIPVVDESGSYYKVNNEAKVLSVQTLMKVREPKVSRSGGSVRVGWMNIRGESGYQISRTINKNETYVVWTAGENKTNVLLKDKGHRYYKVRAYKVVDGVKVFAPWSESVRM